MANVDGVFGFPIYYSSIDVTDVEYKTLINSDFRDPDEYGFQVTRDNHLLDGYEELRRRIEEHVKNYVYGVLIFEGVEIYIKTSWATRATKGSLSKRHSHQNAIVSGVVHLTTVEEGGELTLFHPFPIALNNNYFDIPIGRQNGFNSLQWVIPPKKNNLVLFPSQIEHAVEICTEIAPRYSLAFDVFFRGILSEGGVCELDLK